MCYFVLIRQRKRGRAIGNWEREGRSVGHKASEKERERGGVVREGGGERERGTVKGRDTEEERKRVKK